MAKNIKALKRALFPSKYLRREVDRLSALAARQHHEIEQLQKEVRALRHLVPADWNAFARMMKPLVPHRARGVEKIRVGAAGDGGYIMLNDTAGIEAAYSLGIGGDVSWDLAMARLGLPIFQFDHTVEGPPVAHELFRFHQRKIGPVPDPASRTVSLDQLLRDNAHLGRNLILKIDIDGAEWDVIDQLDGDLLKNFRQIICELHDLNRFIDPAWNARAARVIAKLTRCHRLIHVHGNNFVLPFWNGVADFPDVLEASFALASAFDLVESDETFPGLLDCANARGTPDIPLGNFRFKPTD
jgi:hypothetical protein